MIPSQYTKSIMKKVITIAISRKQAQPAPSNGQKEKQAQTNGDNIPAISTKIRLVDNPNTKVRAEASVNIGGAYAVHGLRVVEGQKGMFVSMPQRQYTDANGETKYSDIFHAVTPEARQAIIQSVSQAYEQAVSQAQTEDAAETMDSPKM